MAKYRNRLPQLSELFLTDGGLETTLVFHDGFELPYFAAFDLLKSAAGQMRLQRYFEDYLAIAKQHRVGFILESATWRASPDWANRLGYSSQQLDRLNRRAIAQLAELRQRYENAQTRVVISGCVGPRGDGYTPGDTMTAMQAEDYHGRQIGTLAHTEADMITAITMNYAEEAVGIVRAAGAAGMPVAISFTVETDGRLPTGQSLQEAIEQTDELTDTAPAYYMINCAHPEHFADVLNNDAPWLERIRGLRANASTKSHAELDAAETLDDGNPEELGQQYRALSEILPNLTVLGGCCGTDHRHVAAIGQACIAARRAA